MTQQLKLPQLKLAVLSLGVGGTYILNAPSGITGFRNMQSNFSTPQ